MENKQIITILGSTGSIGTQALQVIGQMGNTLRVGFLSAHNNIKLLAKQIQKFKPIGVVVKNEKDISTIKELVDTDCKFLYGEKGLIEAASYEKNNIVLIALVGFSGVLPTLSAIEHCNTICLANKETLVSAGSIVIPKVEKHNCNIIAVDSEHNAILQCLVGEEKSFVEKIILTASGGPFLNTSFESNENLSLANALQHPKWTMGSKITIDSATMMNKGFEIIEAKWLFDMEPAKIDVLIHPQSIIHSLVQFVDGSMKAQLGNPDMRIPISYALNYPKRYEFDFPRLDLTEISKLEFFKPDLKKFRCLALAYEAMKIGGNACTIINAANEIAVHSFLQNKIQFLDIAKFIEIALNKINIIPNPSLDDVINTDLETRNFTEKLIN